MASSSYAKKNLDAVIASQIQSLNDYDRLKHTSLAISVNSFEDKTINLHNSGHSTTYVQQKQNGFVVTGMTSPTSVKSFFDSNNNSLPNGLTPSVVSVCQSQMFNVGTSPPHLASKQAHLQRKPRTTKRSRDSESYATILSDVSSSSSPSTKRKKSPQLDCTTGSTIQFSQLSNTSTTPMKLTQASAILPDTTSVTASLPYEITVTGKKKGTKGSVGASGARRNERERNRVKQVNMGFDKLREHVPQGRQNKKLSKVDTLKAAVCYIQQLQQILGLTEEFLTNSHNFDEDEIISDKILAEENFEEESDNDSEAFDKMNSNEMDYDDGLTVLANASCLAEKENLFTENPLLTDSKQVATIEFRSQTGISDNYFVNNQPCVVPSEQFIFQENTLLADDTSKINELHLEELISSLSSHQQQELLMGALNSEPIQAIQTKTLEIPSNFVNQPPAFMDNFMTCQQKSNDVLTTFQPNLDHLISHQTNEKYGSLLEVLMSENVDDLFMDFKSNNSVDENLLQFRHNFNPRR